MKVFRMFLVVLAAASYMLAVGCGSMAPSNDSASDISIYFVSMNASQETAIVSCNSNGGGKAIVQNYQSAGTHESVALSPDRSVLITQFKYNHKHYLHMLKPSGTTVHDSWPSTLYEYPAYNASFSPNSDLTYITGEAAGCFLNFATSDTNYAALCAASAESLPNLSKNSSYDAFNRFGDIYVKAVYTSASVVNLTPGITTDESCPVFSPVTEGKLAFICEDLNGFYIAKIEDVSNPTVETLNADMSHFIGGIYKQLVWSNDGNYLYLIGDSLSGYDTIYRFDANTGHMSPIADSPTFSTYVDLKKLPGSSRLFFVNLYTTDSCEVYSVDPTSKATLEVNSDGKASFFNINDIAD
jgi:hypothetical protein